MPALLDPLRNTLDHLALDPKARDDRKYLVSMLRRLGYSDKEIEAALGWEGDGPRVIEVEYVPPGHGPAPGSFTVVEDWVSDEPVQFLEATVGFSVAREPGDAAQAHGWLDDDPALVHGWLPPQATDEWEPLEDTAWSETARLEEQNPPAWPEQPEDAVQWEDATDDAEAAWSDSEEPQAETPWPVQDSDASDEAAWAPGTLDETDGTAWAEAPAQETQSSEGAWQVVEETDPWSDAETEWAEDLGPQDEASVWDTDVNALETEIDSWHTDDASANDASWDEPTAGHAPSEDYAITQAPAGAWPAPFTFEDYTLYTRMVELSTGREQRIFFFAKNPPKSGQPCPLPPGYIVETNERTGLPFLRRDPAAEAVDVSQWGADEADDGFDEEVACFAITKAGTQCRNAPRESSKYCAVHKGWRGPRVE